MVFNYQFPNKVKSTLGVNVYSPYSLETLSFLEKLKLNLLKNFTVEGKAQTLLKLPETKNADLQSYESAFRDGKCEKSIKVNRVQKYEKLLIVQLYDFRCFVTQFFANKVGCFVRIFREMS